MASLVADYGNSSGSEDEQDQENSDSESSKDIVDDEDNSTDNDNEELKQDDASNKKLPLPTPDFNGAPTLKTSVFSNPFAEAERAKSAMLEKHVKMTPTLDDTKMINGRKICWNYRKGRCRFGHNCTFAHDSDLHRTAAELEALHSPQETIICQKQYTGQVTIDEDDEIDQENSQTIKRKKRPGLSQTLIPSKKVLKIYKAQQAKAVGR
ncbi:unnamed protein product [Trichogramma brassicae]|uniref:C3H1-type domain-containing protein n=1 Tax=Trichogramma brassicae TaxID=86971 RepID=A0A6H5J3T7_9HYME|nr:uncharacterized protein LOC106651050 [Trichogramma pretiosum]CAB0042147.1 unnamed protein product [Trichogramma brassicae]